VIPMILPEAPHPAVARAAALPPLAITRAAFDALLDYSGTLPTGVADGKMWRANLIAYDRDAAPVQLHVPRLGLKVVHRHPPVWVVRRYERCTDPKHSKHDEFVRAGGCFAIVTYRPEFV